MELEYIDKFVQSETILDELRGKSALSLLLQNCTLEDGIWAQLAQGTDGYRVHCLILNYTNLNGKVQNLPECIVGLGVRELSLVDTSLQSLDLQQLRDELKLAKEKGTIQLHSLCLMHVTLEPSGCEILAQVLNLIPNVEELDITNCKLTDDAMKKLCDSISFGKRIKTLRLGENENITDNGMTAVGILSKKCNIEMLDLSYCDLIYSRLEKLSENQETIKELILRGNVYLPTDKVCDLLIMWKELVKIDVTECNLDWNDVEKLTKRPKQSCERKIQIIHNVEKPAEAVTRGRMANAVGYSPAPSSKDWTEGSVNKTLFKEMPDINIHPPDDLKKLEQDDIKRLSLTQDQIALQTIAKCTKHAKKQKAKAQRDFYIKERRF